MRACLPCRRCHCRFSFVHAAAAAAMHMREAYRYVSSHEYVIDYAALRLLRLLRCLIADAARDMPLLLPFR